ncbi:hypothetical protein [uncultured Bacteroides sp.]|uniref:hypothetical protein n=1 Tax=uncultured Bacteroides sp. TaxID=162156 RepID=UPI002AA624E5|nr:hypothetical protein [uncultured Bacteroides sp.]
MESKELNLNLNVEEINTVLSALAELKFSLVSNIIGKIQEQSYNQLMAEQPQPDFSYPEPEAEQPQEPKKKKLNK